MTKYLTKQGLEKFKKELEYLEKTKRKEVSERISHTAAHGDLKENAAYDAAKEEQGFLEARIKELKKILSQAEVITKKQTNKVIIGCFVSLKSSQGLEKFQIVEPEETDVLNNKISLKSPLGGAIVNKQKGDIVLVDLPAGKEKYEIFEIS